MARPDSGWFDELPQNRLMAEFSLWSADLVRLADDLARIAPHATTGALAGAGATLAGTAAHVATHTTTGALVADGATLAGAAATPLKAFFGGGGFVGKPWWLHTKDDEDKPDEQPQIEAEIEAMVAEIPAVARHNMFTHLVRNAKRARDNGAPLEDAFAAQRARTKTRQRRDAEMLLLMD